MASEYSSIARPYAEAVFGHAVERDNLDTWSEMLEFMAAAVADKTLAAIITNPSVNSSDLAKLLLEIGGGRLNDESANLIKLLVQNKRLMVLPEIASQFEALKNQKQGVVDVVITSAFEMKPAQEKLVKEALEKKISSTVTITNIVDSDLIGGIHIKVGDDVIDGTIKGQLHKLANELGI